MKKLMSIIATSAVLLSLSACYTKNNGVTGGGANIGRTTRSNTAVKTSLKYKDGTYTAYGDPHDNMYEMATVIIKNGKIADIDLATTTLQAGNNSRNMSGTGLSDLAGEFTGTSNKGTYNNQSGTKTNIIPSNGLRTNYATGINNGTTGGTNNTAGNGTAVGGAIGKGTGDALSKVRTNLVNAMIKSQNNNVNIKNNDKNAKTTIKNWKLAVGRALDNARR